MHKMIHCNSELFCILPLANLMLIPMEDIFYRKKTYLIVFTSNHLVEVTTLFNYPAKPNSIWFTNSWDILVPISQKNSQRDVEVFLPYLLATKRPMM